MGKLLGRFFVFFTIILISFNGYSSQIFIIWPWYGREVSVDLLKLTVPFKCVCSISPVCIKSWSEPGRSLLLAMLWWNYYLCIVTDPGRVPPQWVHTNVSNDPKHPSLNLSVIVGARCIGQTRL